MTNRAWSARFKNISGTLTKNNRLNYILLLVSGFLLGLLYRQRFPVKLKEEIDLIVLLNLASTLLVALVITHYGKQRTDEIRIAKNLVIKQAEESIQQGRELTVLFLKCCDAPDESGNREKLSELTALTRKLHNQITDLEELVKLSHICAAANNLTDNCLRAFYAFKSSITDIR